MVSTLALAALSGAFTQPRLYAAPYPGAAAGSSRLDLAGATAVTRAMLSVPEIGPWLGKAYGEIAGVLAEQGRAGRTAVRPLPPSRDWSPQRRSASR